MFDKRGIGPEDLAWIHRDQFVHYVGQARALNDPHDWPQLRRALLKALTAAFLLAPLHPLRDGELSMYTDGPPPLTTGQQRTLELLDDLRPHHDPAADWPTFFDALWEHRHRLRPDFF